MLTLYDNAKRVFDNHVTYILESSSQVKTLTRIQRRSLNLNETELTSEADIFLFRDKVLALTQNKIAHTERGVNDIAELFKIFPGLAEEYTDLAKTIELFHDIGRFMQALESCTFADGASYNNESYQSQGITDHGRHGEQILRTGGMLEKAGIPLDYWEVIYNVVKYHVHANGIPFNMEMQGEKVFFGNSLRSIAKDELARNKFMTLYYQAVTAVDNLDVQRNVLLSGANSLVRKEIGISVREGDTISSIAERWGITEVELKEYNGLETDKLAVGTRLRINSEIIPAEKFQIDDDYATKYMTDTLGTNLPALQRCPKYTFLSAQIFRLHLLRNIAFVPVLQKILDSGMLDKLFELYPDKYKAIMAPFFDFAKEETLARINESITGMYAARTAGPKR